MKKILIKVYALLFVSICLSCSKDLTSLNVDQKNATYANADAFFANAMKVFSDDVYSVEYLANGSGTTRLFMQYITSVTYLEGVHYIESYSWTPLYRDILKDFDEARKILEETDPSLESEIIAKQNKLAILEIMTAYTYSILVDSYGDIPYSEALDIDNVLPKFDSSKDVYLSLLERLKNASEQLNPAGQGFGSNDVLYNGDISKWKKFGNSLLLKLGMRIMDADATAGSAAVATALNGGVFTSNADNAAFKYLSDPPNNHDWYGWNVIQRLRYFVGTKPFVDMLNDLNDPRRPVYFDMVDGSYKGAVSGLPHNYFEYSPVSNRYHQPDLENLFMDYASVKFYLAEAAERGIAGVADAASHYADAIRASFEYYGVGDEADAYLAQPSVNYSTATGNWRQKIGNQKWLALFDQSFEAWAEYRRLDYPVLQAPSAARSSMVPRRFLYPLAEQSINGQNYAEAVSRMGGDTYETKLFWDVN